MGAGVIFVLQGCGGDANDDLHGSIQTGHPDGNHTGDHDGSHTGHHDGSHTGHHDGDHTGDHDGSHTGHPDGSHIGDHDGNHTGHHDGNHTGHPDGNHTGTMTAVTQAMVLVSAEYLKCCRLTCIARGVIGLSLVVASVFFLYIGCTYRDQSAQHDSGGIRPL